MYFFKIPSSKYLMFSNKEVHLNPTLEKHFKHTTLSKDAELITNNTVSPFAISELCSSVNSTSTQFMKTVIPLLD